MYKTNLAFPAVACHGSWHYTNSCQADTRKSWTGLHGRWEQCSGMHELASGSGSQEGQGAGSFSEASLGQTE